MRKLITLILLAVALFTIASVTLFTKSSTRQGIDYVVSEHAIPRWVKMAEFLSRHYRYKKLTAEIVKDIKTPQEKAQAIFQWTRKNIKQEIPENWPIYDDHVLNIIIRGYGTDDQAADVFTFLCTYAGMPSAMYLAFYQESPDHIILALVQVGEKFLVFDLTQGNYFLNHESEIASLDDLISSPSLVSFAKNKPMVKDIRYEDYFRNLFRVEKFLTLRAELQMPLKRIVYEIKRKLGLTKPAILFYGVQTKG